jgi:DNA-binding transcriptional regulator YdaS (Cro superfamily)
MTISDWMKSTNRSAFQLAAILGLSEMAVRRYAQGSRMPEPEIAQRIVEVTEGAVSIQDLHDTRLAFLRSSASHEAA